MRYSLNAVREDCTCNRKTGFACLQDTNAYLDQVLTAAARTVSAKDAPDVPAALRKGAPSK